MGSGGNLAFEGRWQVSVVSELATESRVVPLELHMQGPSLFLSVAAFPGQPVEYTVQLPDNSFIRLTLEPGRTMPSGSRWSSSTSMAILDP